MYAIVRGAVATVAARVRARFARRRAAQPPDGAAASALAALRSSAGPLRFSQVGPRLYRGGQPSERQLALLKRLGVATVISLRHDGRAARRAEREAAQRLGLKYLRFPFSGVLGASAALLGRIVEAMQGDRDGAVYLHCKRGRDRTSLAVAVYRVWVDGWPPELAWQREAIAFGHRSWLFLRGLRRSFDALTKTRVRRAPQSGS